MSARDPGVGVGVVIAMGVVVVEGLVAGVAVALGEAVLVGVKDFLIEEMRLGFLVAIGVGVGALA